MSNFQLSAHVLERAAERGIAAHIIEDILQNPDRILDDESGETDQKVYQSFIAFPEKGTYLVRVFVNCGKQPNVVKTVYKTSKINKYV